MSAPTLSDVRPPVWGKIIRSIIEGAGQEVEASESRQLNYTMRAKKIQALDRDCVEINFVLTEDALRALTQLYDVTFCRSVNPYLDSAHRHMVLRVQEREA